MNFAIRSIGVTLMNSFKLPIFFFTYYHELGFIDFH